MPDVNADDTEIVAVDVRLATHSVPFVDPFIAYTRMRDWLGPDRVYLLESLSGPLVDRQAAMVGFRPLMTIELYGDQLEIHGLPGLVGNILAAVDASALTQLEAGKRRLREPSDLWPLLRTIQRTFSLTAPSGGSSYNFGFFGYFGYDTVRFIERLPYRIEKKERNPEIILALFEGVIKFDLTARHAQIVCGKSAYWLPTDVDDLASRLSMSPEETIEDIPDVPAADSVTDSTTPAVYYEDVRTALHHISIGDIYQVQIGHEIAIRSRVDPLVVYRRLRTKYPAPYMYLAQLGTSTLIGASPEVFVKIEGAKITMRPLAGTIRRGQGEDEDRAAALKLRSDEKEIAEHVMLVDLCRNDIGRICVPKTLAVPQLLATEAYSRVYHLVSTVVGEVAAGLDVYDAIAATFPAGTMTGAPKVRAMEIIEDLETSRRGVYAGAVGLIDFSGYANLALCIRTAVCTGDNYVIRASAGIVADSKPEQEWQETLTKMSSMYWAIVGKDSIQ